MSEHSSSATKSFNWLAVVIVAISLLIMGFTIIYSIINWNLRFFIMGMLVSIGLLAGFASKIKA